jgi:HSP20 family protein
MRTSKKIVILLVTAFLIAAGAHPLFAQRVNVKSSAQNIAGADEHASEAAPLTRRNPDRSHEDAQAYRFDPFAEFIRMQGVLRRMMEDWDTGSARGEETFFSPAIDVRESKDAYTIRCDIPGLEKEKIDIALNKNILTISGERSHAVEKEQDEDGAFYHVSERRFGAFQRSFSLPEDILEDEIRAEYVSGVLTVTIPRAPVEADDTVRKIQIL